MTATTTTPSWMNVDAIPVDIRAEISEQIERLRDALPKLVKQTSELGRLADRYSEVTADLPEDVRDHFDVATGYDELDELVGLVGGMFSLDGAGEPADPIDVIAKRLGVDALWA
jgi:hypothetical protein